MYKLGSEYNYSSSVGNPITPTTPLLTFFFSKKFSTPLPAPHPQSAYWFYTFSEKKKKKSLNPADKY